MERLENMTPQRLSDLAGKLFFDTPITVSAIGPVTQSHVGPDMAQSLLGQDGGRTAAAEQNAEEIGHGVVRCFVSAAGPRKSSASTGSGPSSLSRDGDYPEWSRLREASRTFLEPWEPKWAEDDLTRSGIPLPYPAL
jgi:hypothetical protein